MKNIGLIKMFWSSGIRKPLLGSGMEYFLNRVSSFRIGKEK